MKQSCESAEYHAECLQDKLNQEEQKTCALYHALLVMVSAFEKLELDPSTIATPTPVRTGIIPATFSTECRGVPPNSAVQSVLNLVTTLQGLCLPETHPRILQQRKQQQRWHSKLLCAHWLNAAHKRDHTCSLVHVVGVRMWARSLKWGDGVLVSQSC